MTRRKSCHLLGILAKLKDPRKDKGKRHPLKSILALIVIGLMCGHISLFGQKSENRRRNAQSPLWYHKSKYRSSICRTLNGWTAWALVNREQVVLDAGNFTWRRCITCPMWRNTTSHGSFVQYRIICPLFRRNNAYSG